MGFIEITRELNRVSKILDETKNTDKILVNSEYGDQDLPEPNDPYPIFFTAEQLFKKINNGSWHMVGWYLEDKKIMKKKILKRINELQKRLIEL